MYKHLLIIADGEIQENSLHLANADRTAHLHEWVATSEWKDETHAAMREADIDAAQADYPEGCFPHPMDSEDYIDTIRDVLADCEVDVYLGDVAVPGVLRVLRAA